MNSNFGVMLGGVQLGDFIELVAEFTIGVNQTIHFKNYTNDLDREFHIVYTPYLHNRGQLSFEEAVIVCSCLEIDQAAKTAVFKDNAVEVLELRYSIADRFHCFLLARAS